MDHVLHHLARHSRSGLIARIRAALDLRRQRRRLRYLSDHLLDDIGISREAAEREASRPVWDVPHTWRS